MIELATHYIGTIIVYGSPFYAKFILQYHEKSLHEIVVVGVLNSFYFALHRHSCFDFFRIVF